MIDDTPPPSALPVSDVAALVLSALTRGRTILGPPVNEPTFRLALIDAIRRDGGPAWAEPLVRHSFTDADLVRLQYSAADQKRAIETGVLARFGDRLLLNPRVIAAFVGGPRA